MKNRNPFRPTSELLRDDEAIKARQLKAARDGRRRKQFRYALLAAMPILVVVAGLILALSSHAPRTTNVVAQGSSRGEATATVRPSGTQPWYAKSGANLIPAKAAVPTYASKQAPAGFAAIDVASSPQTVEASQTLSGTTLGTQIKGTFAPELTDDPKDATSGRSKTPSASYSYWTAQTFSTETTDLVERLLNPVYGGWSAYQSAGSDAASKFDISAFRNDLAPTYYKTLAKATNKSAFPVYADWRANNYGLKDLIPVGGAPRWFGKVTNATAKWHYDLKTANYTVVSTYNVIFSALTTSHRTITRKGVLTIKWVAGTSVSPQLPRVVIAGGNLRVQTN